MMKSCVRVCIGVMMMLGTVKGRTDLNVCLFVCLITFEQNIERKFGVEIADLIFCKISTSKTKHLPNQTNAWGND